MKKPEKIVSNVVDQLVSIRKKKGLSHDKVAARCGLHRSTISLIESGKNQGTLLTLIKIAQALECDLGEILIKAQSKS